METVRYFRLRNAGAFVARIEVVCYVEEGENASKHVAEPTGYHDILASAERTVDLAELRYKDSSGKERPIPEGATVRLKAFVKWGTDKTAKEEYAYSSSSGAMKTYKISGTTLNSTLALVE